MPGNISTSLKNWSTTATSNQPDSGDAATVQADFQNVQAAVRSALADRQSIAAGSTVDLGSVDSLFVNVSSSGATITSFGTGTANLFRIVTFAGANTLTHNGTSLILPGASNITTAAGDSCLVEMLGSSNHKVHVYQKASGLPVVSPSGAITSSGFTQATARLLGRTTASTGAIEEITVGTGLSLSAGSLTATGSGFTLGTPTASTSGTSIDFTGIPTTARMIVVTFVGVSTNNTSPIQVQIGDSGGVETSGYSTIHETLVGGTGSSQGTSTAGWQLTPTGLAADVFTGQLILIMENSTNWTWIGTGQWYQSVGTAYTSWSTGSKATSAATDRVRITTVGGTATFDAGEVNVAYI